MPIRKMLDGMCVKTMVWIRPMRADSHAAIGNDTVGQDPGDEEEGAGQGRLGAEARRQEEAR